MQRPYETEPQHCAHVRDEEAGRGGDPGQAPGHITYGSTSVNPAPFVVHGRARQFRAGGVRRNRAVDGHYSQRLSGVPEGDETQEDGAPATGARLLQTAVPARMFFSVIAWSVMAPLIIMGPRLGKDMLDAPKQLPAHQWMWTSVQAPAREKALPVFLKGSHLTQISQNGLAKLSAKQTQVDAAGLGRAVADAVTNGGGDDLLRTFGTFGTIQHHGDDAMGIGPAGDPEQVRMQQTQQGTEIVKVGRRSIWNYGPFVFTLGVMLSVLAKLLIAQPLAKFGTDLLHMWAGTQQPTPLAEEYYGYVYLEREEEYIPGITPRSSAAKTPEAPAQSATENKVPRPISSAAASEAETPRVSLGMLEAAPSTPKSSPAAAHRLSSGKKRWSVTIDVPEPAESPVGLVASIPRDSSSASDRPSGARTSPGDSLMKELEVSG